MLGGKPCVVNIDDSKARFLSIFTFPYILPKHLTHANLEISESRSSLLNLSQQQQQQQQQQQSQQWSGAKTPIQLTRETPIKVCGSHILIALKQTPG